MTTEELKTLKDEISAFERGELEELQRGRWVTATEFNAFAVKRVKPQPIKMWALKSEDGKISQCGDEPFDGSILLEESAPLHEKIRVKDEAIRRAILHLDLAHHSETINKLQEAMKA